jgi:hypothetical protein
MTIEKPPVVETAKSAGDRMQADIRRALELFHPPGEVFEIRIPAHRINGRLVPLGRFFDDIDQAVEFALKYDGRVEGI